MADDEEAPDPTLTPQQQKLVAALSPAQIRAIDLALLANIATHWRKMARIIGAAMLDVESRAAGIPDIYYAERVRVLVERGLIESQGDMSRMRLGEVRFAVRTASPDPKPKNKPAARGTGHGRKGSGNVAASGLDAVAVSADASWIDLSSFVDEAAPAKGVDADSGVSGLSEVPPVSQDASQVAESNLQAVAASPSTGEPGRFDSSSHEHAGALARGVEADAGASGVSEVPPVSQDASQVAASNLNAVAASASAHDASLIDSSSPEDAGAPAQGVDADSGGSAASSASKDASQATVSSLSVFAASASVADASRIASGSYEDEGAFAKGIDPDSGVPGVSDVDPGRQDANQVAASNLHAVAASASADDADSGTSSADSAHGMAPENKDASQATPSSFDAIATLASADDASRIDSSSNDDAANLAKDIDADSGAANANADVGTVAGRSVDVSSTGPIATDSAGDSLASGDDVDGSHLTASGTDSAAGSPAVSDTDMAAGSSTISGLSLPDASDSDAASCEVSVSEAHGPDHF